MHVYWLQGVRKSKPLRNCRCCLEGSESESAIGSIFSVKEYKNLFTSTGAAAVKIFGQLGHHNEGEIKGTN
jgi:hypothetical protein